MTKSFYYFWYFFLMTKTKIRSTMKEKDSEDAQVKMPSGNGWKEKTTLLRRLWQPLQPMWNLSLNSCPLCLNSRIFSDHPSTWLNTLNTRETTYIHWDVSNFPLVICFFKEKQANLLLKIYVNSWIYQEWELLLLNYVFSFLNRGTGGRLATLS